MVEKLFWRFIDICILNSWIIFWNNLPESKIQSHRLFCTELIHELVQPLLSLRADPDCPTHLLYAQGHRPTESEKRLRGKHFPFRPSKHGRCVVCYNSKTPSGKRKDTKVVTYCPKCEVHLCIGGCFENFHTKSKY